MEDESLIGIQEGGVDEQAVRKRGGKINLDDDSLINELNFCFMDP